MWPASRAPGCGSLHSEHHVSNVGTRSDASLLLRAVCCLQLVAQMNLKQSLANAGMWDHRSGITITGYTALFCFSALCTTVVMTMTYAYKRWRGVKDTTGYVQVVKQGDV